MQKGNPNPSPATRFGAPRGNKQSPGGWKPENTLSYQYKRFMSMTVAELEAWAMASKGSRTVAMELAYNRIIAAQTNLADVKEITNRTEGVVQQQTAVILGSSHTDTYETPMTIDLDEGIEMYQKMKAMRAKMDAKRRSAEIAT